MNIDDILTMWERDSHIDQTELGTEALKISQLHHRYYRVYVQERLLKKKLDQDMRDLKLAKHEFYLHGPSPETTAMGWKPASSRVLRSDVSTYIDADPQVAEMSLKIAYVQEKVDALESIIKTISNRNFALKTAVEFLRFTNGS